MKYRPEPLTPIPNGKWGKTREERIGVMLHYDASSTDEGALRWFADPGCRVSYNWLVLDNGKFVEIAPHTARAWHAGRCKPSHPRLVYHDANSAFYGIAAATNARVAATMPQLLTIAALTRDCFTRHGWQLHDSWRVTTHSAEAWPRGRKLDPEGPDKHRPIYTVNDICSLMPLV